MKTKTNNNLSILACSLSTFQILMIFPFFSSSYKILLFRHYTLHSSLHSPSLPPVYSLFFSFHRWQNLQLLPRHKALIDLSFPSLLSPSRLTLSLYLLNFLLHILFLPSLTFCSSSSSSSPSPFYLHFNLFPSLSLY